RTSSRKSPKIVTCAPPMVEPELGSRLVTVGALPASATSAPRAASATSAARHAPSDVRLRITPPVLDSGSASLAGAVTAKSSIPSTSAQLAHCDAYRKYYRVGI